MWVKALGQYELLGETIDDAAGEAFDKSAKLLGLGYPGGPALAALANQGSADAYAFPRPLLHQPNLDFSFAGLKTAVLTQCKKSADQLPQHRADIAASTQAAIVEVLVKKSLRALTQTGSNRLVVAGGVGANRALRTQLTTSVQGMGATVHFPAAEWCTDNGAMIAMAAGMRLQQGIEQAHTSYAFDVLPRWPLAQI
jgi:N6-L-threonylcarbamoyladenine synthase